MTPARSTSAKRPASRTIASGAATLGLGVVLIACTADAAESVDDGDLSARALAMVGTLEAPSPESVEAPAALLGRHLFWDERLSVSGTTACASCHIPEAAGADSRARSIDARGAPTSRNSQTVFNAMEQASLRWLGDRRDGAHQAELSIAGAMGFADPQNIVPVLIEHGYLDAFRAAFPDDPDPVSPAAYGRALQAYQSTLITPAPFDAYLAGDVGALSPQQKEGLDLFLSIGCTACHSGKLLGGGSLQKFGMTEDYWTATGSAEIDPGRFAVSGEEPDRYVFRTPMLRNIARTGPYFHDGSVAELSDAVRIMARVQLGRDLSAPDLDRIVAFLESLSGEIPARYSPPAQ